METEINKGTRTFKDARGREWDVTFTLAGAKRIDKADLSAVLPDVPKFSILKPDRQLFGRILTDTSLMFAIIWVIVQPQVKAVLGIDPEEEPELAEQTFLEGLDGEALLRGKEAFWGAMSDFFHAHKTVLEGLFRNLEQANRKLQADLGAMEPEIKKTLEAEVDKGLKKLRAELKTLGGKSSE